jgi:hypothetical protein
MRIHPKTSPTTIITSSTVVTSNRLEGGAVGGRASMATMVGVAAATGTHDFFRHDFKKTISLFFVYKKVQKI